VSKSLEAAYVKYPFDVATGTPALFLKPLAIILSIELKKSN